MRFCVFIYTNFFGPFEIFFDVFFIFAFYSAACAILVFICVTIFVACIRGFVHKS